MLPSDECRAVNPPDQHSLTLSVLVTARTHMPTSCCCSVFLQKKKNKIFLSIGRRSREGHVKKKPVTSFLSHFPFSRRVPLSFTSLILEGEWKVGPVWKNRSSPEMQNKWEQLRRQVTCDSETSQLAEKKPREMMENQYKPAWLVDDVKFWRGELLRVT